MGARRHRQEGALSSHWKCCKVFLCISSYSIPVHITDNQKLIYNVRGSPFWAKLIRYAKMKIKRYDTIRLPLVQLFPSQ